MARYAVRKLVHTAFVALGVVSRVSFKPRADYRLIVAEMTLGAQR